MSQAGKFVTGGIVPPGTAVVTLTSNTGGAVPPNGAGNINVVGDGVTITGVGNPGTNTITLSVIGGGSGIQTITGNTGGPVPPDGADNINIVTQNTTLDVAGIVVANTLTINFAVTHLLLGTDGSSNGTANRNIGIGINALNALINGSDNVCIGENSGRFLTTSSGNTVVGSTALQSATAGGNTVFGNAACQSLTTGSANIAIGPSALITLLTGSNNIQIGQGTFYTSSESNNILLGSVGILGDNNTLRIGGGTGSGVKQQNRAFISGVNGVTASNAVMVTIDSFTDQLGVAAIPGSGIVTINGDTGSITGDPVTFTANPSAGSSISFDGSATTMTFNVTDGLGNTIFGMGSGNGTLTGQSNNAFGQSAISSLTSGNNNTAQGAAAMFAIQSGSDNVAIGQHALYAGGGVGLTTGSNNIGIGSNAGSAYLSSESNNICLGTPGVIGDQAQQRLGNPAIITNTFIAGNVQKPNQCAFSAYLSSSTTNNTGSGTSFTIIYDQEIIDINNDYDNTTGTFTAPVTGIYQFTATGFFQNMSVTNTDTSLELKTVGAGNQDFFGSYINGGTAQITASGGLYQSTASFIVSLTVGDIVNIVATVSGGVGDTVGFLGNATIRYTYFSGYLVA